MKKQAQSSVGKSSPDHYPAAMVNITNRCTLRCRHCFIYRQENPHTVSDEMPTADMLARLAELKQIHPIETMLWMGGELLLRPDVLEKGVGLFKRNTVTTNGTLDLNLNSPLLAEGMNLKMRILHQSVSRWLKVTGRNSEIPGSLLPG